MDNDFAVLKSTINQPVISIKALWKVEADSRYDVYKGLQIVDGDVFWRTLNGEGKLVLKNGQSFILKENTLLRVKNVDIARYNCLGNRWHFWWYNSLVDNHLNIPEYKVIPMDFDSYERINMEGILNNLKSPFSYSHEIANADCLSLFLRWAGKIHKSPAILSESSRRLQSALWYIHNHFDKQIPIEKLASLSNYSVRRFRDLFTKETGTSPVHYIRNHRMEAAVNMLLHTNMSMGDIAVNTGFSTEQYFSRVFQREYKQSPAKYRRLMIDGLL